MKRNEMKNLESRLNNQILRCTQNDNLGSLPYFLTFSLVSNRPRGPWSVLKELPKCITSGMILDIDVE